ncbi:hypothetical protein ABB37_06138 [Leptomonas pyrrhocoris]|uniref:Uncharacterized protein n=1 Tax=Leptomonas pyrrhocoris TaxID=157538 RepID=A0A0N0VER4_LEPPY|nr:hypothetical protein ABB37_06138 [Leptomonas pyrrhocoris]KPA78532.1 hypothetical protein ABB37_06138 [Leptomonas pyrrhocoris]|eukprot:XP_015656971.1 hypothetical protein ABB37_06138 [Leptomonas pyrrhocoris]
MTFPFGNNCFIKNTQVTCRHGWRCSLSLSLYIYTYSARSSVCLCRGVLCPRISAHLFYYYFFFVLVVICQLFLFNLFIIAISVFFSQCREKRLADLLFSFFLSYIYIFLTRDDYIDNCVLILAPHALQAPDLFYTHTSLFLLYFFRIVVFPCSCILLVSCVCQKELPPRYFELHQLST